MSVNKFKRLCMVLFLPLLIIGVLASLIFWPYPRSAEFFCEYRYDDYYCRGGGEIGSAISKIIEKQQQSGIQIYNPKENILDSFYVFNISPFVLHGAKIIKAEPFLGHSQAVKEFMSTLVGREVSILFNSIKGEKSFVMNNKVLLYCNSFDFKSPPGTYTSDCWGDEWGGPVTFKVDDASQDREILDKLKFGIDGEVKNMRLDHIIYMLIVYPAFFYGFLVLSLLYWLGILAARYVRKG